MLQPFVVEVESERFSSGTSTAAASFPRTRSRSSLVRAKYSAPPRPFSRSARFCAIIASTVGRASGPFVPAFR